MSKRHLVTAAVLTAIALCLAAGCGGGGEPTVDHDEHDKDFSPYRTAGAMEKAYDYSHFNIAGRVFGAMGAPADNDQTGIFSVGLERTIGRRHPVKR